jgi:hypothetical protein
MRVTITVDDVDLELLKKQRDVLLDVISWAKLADPRTMRDCRIHDVDLLDGVVHLFDHVLDEHDPKNKGE